MRVHLVLATSEESLVDPLIVDVYSGDGPKDWKALAAAGRPWVGALLKATQGTYYRPVSWFNANWRALKEAGGERYGIDWFRGAYHYLDVSRNGTAQAEYFLRALHDAGGLDGGTIAPMVDVELADQPDGATKAQVEDCAGAFMYRVKEVTGRGVMLYGGSYLWELGITSHMGAKWLAIARYTSTLPAVTYRRIGWQQNDLALWQYCGDGVAALPGYPKTAPGCGAVDISAAVLGWDRLHELVED